MSVIPGALGEVKQTVSIPTAITISVVTADTPALVDDRCRDQHEYCLLKTFKT